MGVTTFQIRIVKAYPVGQSDVNRPSISKQDVDYTTGIETSLTIATAFEFNIFYTFYEPLLRSGNCILTIAFYLMPAGNVTLKST